MVDYTPRLGAQLLALSQAAPETLVNAALMLLDASVMGGWAFIDRDLAAPPGAPAQGATYLVAGSPTGAWAGQAGKVAIYINTTWEFLTPQEGWEAWVTDEAVKIGYSSGAWGIIGTFDGANYIASTGGTATGPIEVPAEAYGAGWDGDNSVPTKNDLYDKFEAVIAGVPGTYTDEMAQDAVAAMLAAGTHTNVTVTYGDGGNSMSLAAPGAYTDEMAQDAVAAMLAAGTHTNITVTYGDGGNSMSLAVSGLAAYTDENARDAIGTALVVAGALNKAVDDAGDTITISQGVVSSQAGSYTAVLADANTYIRFTGASATNFTIPPNSSVAFPIGTVIEVEQAGAGALSFLAGAGVTLNSRASDLTLAGQYSVAFAKKVATDTWTVNGDL